MLICDKVHALAGGKTMKVSIVFMGSLKQLNGAAKVVNMFDKYKRIFTEENIAYGNVFSYDMINQNSFSETRKSQDTDKKGNVVGAFKRLLSDILKNTYLGNRFSIQYFTMHRAKDVIDYYQKTQMDEDILIFHDIFTLYYFTKICDKRCLNKKIVFIHHNTGDEWKSFRMYYPKIAGTKFYKCLEKISLDCYKRADAIVFVSDTSRDYFLQLHPNKFNSKTHVIKNGIDDIGAPCQRDYTSLRMITVGTVNERKNQLNLIKVLSEIGDDNISLTVVGDGERYVDCVSYVQEHGMKNIKLLGKRTDVSELLSDSNVFIMTSLGEGLSIAAIEAMRSGLPLILTDVGGSKELIDGNGYLIGCANDEIKKAIITANDNLESLKEMGNCSRKLFLDKFDSKNMIRNYCKLVKAL